MLCLFPVDEAAGTRWAVQRVPGGERFEFDDEFAATASYIKQYVDDVVAGDTLWSNIWARLWIWRHLR
jgi:hypothetical protein